MGLRLSKESREVEMATYASLRHSSDTSGAEQIAKRVFDVVVASCILLFTAPLILTIAIFIRLQDGGPAVFKQMRLGKDGEQFACYKLRSMVTDAGDRLQQLLATDPDARREWAETQKLTNDPRITALGQFIRKSSIDELPQLFNVLWGDMSLVGPRPMMVDQRALYPGTAYYAMRPGITGIWQTSVRNESSFSERAIFDARYFRELSFVTDLALIARTFRVVLRGTGY